LKHDDPTGSLLADEYSMQNSGEMGQKLTN